ILIQRIKLKIAAALLALLLLQSATTLFGIYEKRGHGMSPRPPGLSALWRMSRQGNVLVFLLDGLQSQVAKEALSRSPD
ncbi:hypothetical protein, partial [Klebsiella pneumoniae]|uniref:hypothetical protein n=1 Tax=Klebsiella pneumoniae TaxID=573 RepID=UPI001954EE03